jgi:hypothetical protein
MGTWRLAIPVWSSEQDPAARRGGGRLFPYAVHVTPAAEIFVRARLDETATSLVGARIDMLDGPHDVAEKLLAHMNGDTVALRAQLLSERFAFWYWKFYGERKTFRLRIAGTDSIVEASSATHARTRRSRSSSCSDWTCWTAPARY